MNESETSDTEHSRVGVELFCMIAKEWNLTNDQAYTLLSLDDFAPIARWKYHLALDEDIESSEGMLELVACIVGTYRNLQSLFDNPDQWKK